MVRLGSRLGCPWTLEGYNENNDVVALQGLCLARGK